MSIYIILKFINLVLAVLGNGGENLWKIWIANFCNLCLANVLFIFWFYLANGQFITGKYQKIESLSADKLLVDRKTLNLWFSRGQINTVIVTVVCALFTRQHLANVTFTSHFYVTIALTEHPQIKPNCPLFKVKWFAFIFCTCLQEISCTALSCQCAQITWWCPNRFKTDETLSHFL